MSLYLGFGAIAGAMLQNTLEDRADVGAVDQGAQLAAFPVLICGSGCRDRGFILDHDRGAALDLKLLKASREIAHFCALFVR